MTFRMPIYQCHKLVRAAQILTVEGYTCRTTAGSVRLEQSFLDKFEPKPGMFLVEYEDGYRSVSPESAFAGGYTLLADQDGAEAKFGGEPDTDADRTSNDGLEKTPAEKKDANNAPASGLSYDGMQ